jgi:DNA-binding XRE family transcriptional regulator
VPAGPRGRARGKAMIDVTSVQYEGGFRLQLGFEDGTQGVADLGNELVGKLRVLRDDPERFAAAFVDAGTVCWPGGLDLAPSRLYALAHGLPIPQSFEDEAANEREVSLRELRKLAGVTQVELAKKIGITQAELSRFERRPNVQLDTLQRYVEALGGEIEIVAVLGNKRMNVA